MEDNEATQGVQIRFPLRMYEELKSRAARERRSLNNETVYILETYFEIEEMVEKARKAGATEGSGGKAGA
jgi:plasmid stability protein